MKVYLLISIMTGEIFPWIKSTTGTPLSFKWIQDSQCYEIHSPKLVSFELEDLLPHCLEVRQRVITVCAENDHKGPSLYQILGRTLATPLRALWETITSGITQFSVANFDLSLRAFIAATATSDDKHELLQQLRNPSKPRALSVRAFYYRLIELNGYAFWMPGEELSLSHLEIKQAFYDGMPPTWRERFVQAGKSQSQVQQADLIRYFQLQERLATSKASENTLKQRVEASKRARPYHKERHKNLGKSRARQQSKKRKPSNNPPKQRIADDSPCPVHPGASHTWGECYLNAKNKRSKQGNSHTPKTGGKNSAKQTKSSAKSSAVSFAGATCVDIQDLSLINEEEEDPQEEEDTASILNDEAGEFPQTLILHDNDSFQSLTLDSHEFTNTQVDNSNLQCYNAYKAQYILGGNDIFSKINNINTHSSQSFINDIPLNNFSKPKFSLSVHPIGMMLARSIQHKPSRCPLKVLFDSGSDLTFIHQRVLPVDTITKIVSPRRIKTLHGTATISQQVILHDISFPEFSPTQRVDKALNAFVYNQTESPYDVILGLDVLVPLGIEISCSTKTITWNDIKIPWKPKSYLDDTSLTDPQLNESCFCAPPNYTIGYTNLDSFAAPASTTILHSEYTAVNIDDVVKAQIHLNTEQQTELASVLTNFQQLFSGKLGCYPGYKAHLKLLPNAHPSHCRPYSVPRVHKEVFKAELEQLYDAGVLTRCGPSEWLSPTFVIPKKDGRVRWVSDFRNLNKVIKRKVYNLPRIQDILCKRTGYQFFTKLDISMQFYTFKLDKASKKLYNLYPLWQLLL